MDSLSYFHSSDITPGNIVTVSVRNKDIKGLVVSSTNAKDMKQELKEAQYEMKKIKGVSKNPLFNQSFMRAATETAEYFATSPGSIINALIPKYVIDNYTKFQYKEDEVKEEKERGKYIIQTPDEERYGDYKSLIRGQFARKKSVFFCVPTIEDTEYAEEMLTKGIEKQTYVFHSKLTKKKLEERWTECINNKKPCLIIATGSFLGIPKNDIGSIIIERENSRGYRTYSRPYFDIRVFAEIYAKHIKADFIFGDMLLRAETLWRYDQNEFLERTPIKFRTLSTAKSLIIDMKNERKVIDGKKSKEPILSEQLQDLLRKAEKNNEKTFILNSRKGLSPIVLCRDCGQIVKCEHCSSPVTLYGKKANSNDPREKENHFKCRQCLEVRDAGERCTNCDSWNLITLGYGVDAIYEELLKIAPEENIYVLDKERGNTQNKARKIVEEFNTNPSGILLGTEMSLLYLKEEVSNVFITSIDSMFSIPDFHIRERILNILLRAKAKAQNLFVVQTRHKENGIFNDAVSGNIADFYRREFVDRKKFNYPPFSILIKITGTGKTPSKVQKDFEGLQQFLEPFELNYYPGFTERVKGLYVVHGLIRLKRDSWPNTKLKEKLQHLPPQFQIHIDADSVL